MPFSAYIHSKYSEREVKEAATKEIFPSFPKYKDVCLYTDYNCRVLVLFKRQECNI